MLGRWRWLAKDDRGAVAPTVALSLIGLIAAGGIAFDYARLAAMDTELQNAADQAALAAATQLDRGDDAQARAIAAIQGGTAGTRLATNNSRFANDGGDADIAIESIRFCSAFDDSEANIDDACTEADEDDGENSRFVVVTTELRTANYALTPIVAAFSGSSAAQAVAGVESSLCNVAPLLVCVPNDFPSDDDVGKGILLKPLDGVSGNYGLLDFGNGAPAVTEALMGFGLNGCQSTDDNQTEPGTKAQVTDAINTRMDVYDRTNPKVTDSKTKAPLCDLTTGRGCPALNTAKDVVRTETYVVDTALTETITPNAPACGQAGTGFTGELTLGTEFVLNGDGKGYGRDACHYAGNCTTSNGNIGDKDWDRAGYLAKQHPGVTADSIATALDNGRSGDELTRYDIYQWELAQDSKSGTLAPRNLSSVPFTTTTKRIRGTNRKVWTFTKQCRYHRPLFAPGTYPAQKDRRVLPIVAADCTNLKGKGAAYEDYTLLRAFDVFLTEPSLTRAAPAGKTVGTDSKEIYGEVVGPASTFEGGNGFQYYARSKPYLIR